MTTRALAVLPCTPPPPRSTSGFFGVHLVGGYDRIQNQRGPSKPGCPFPFPAVSVVSPRKICWLTPSRRSPIDQEENLEGRGEERDGNKVRKRQPTSLWFIYYFIFNLIKIFNLHILRIFGFSSVRKVLKTSYPITGCMHVKFSVRPAS